MTFLIESLENESIIKFGLTHLTPVKITEM